MAPAIGSAKKALIEDHIDHCLTHADGPGEANVMEQFRAIGKCL